MRNVLKSSEVFHYFANKIQPSGRCSNTSFALPRAYSYAACIGQHIAPNVVALSNATWSNTTSKHQSDLRQACRHLDCVYVPSPDNVHDSYRQVNINVTNLLRKASTAKAKKDVYLGDALHQIEQFNRFAELLKSDLRIASPVTDDAALKQIAVAVKEETAKRNAAIKERDRLDKLSLDETLALWRNVQECNSWQLRRLPVALRINGENIDTSHGASIPLSFAHTLWALINRAIQGQKDYEVGQAVGVYRLTRIRANGSIVVGCHDIAFAELQTIASILGYTS